MLRSDRRSFFAFLLLNEMKQLLKGLVLGLQDEKMKPEEKCVLLVKKIEEIFHEGINLSDTVLDYIDSTFSNPSIKELEDIICDELNCEKDPLIELLFFPDESIQIQLEDLLESEDFKKQDEENILNYLLSKKLETSIHFPDNRGSLKLTMPNSAAGKFISRLNISKKPDKRLVEVIDRFVSNSSGYRADVHPGSSETPR